MVVHTYSLQTEAETLNVVYFSACGDISASGNISKIIDQLLQYQW